MKRLLLVPAVAALLGCSPSGRTADEFAHAPEAARAVVADCEAGRRRTECAAAREGLARAQREARMARYAEAF